jgi:tRNA A37 threonylcarbamoyladenosine modification protein TsaB
MLLAKTIIIQTALKPMTVAYQIEGEWIVTPVLDFAAFFEVMSNFDFEATENLIVNRGPGSYAGMRTGIAYVYGLLHGKVISSDKVSSFTSFDIIRAISGKREIYLKGWPRITSNTFTGSKGYYINTKDEISYVSYEDLEKSFQSALFSDEHIEVDNAVTFNASILLKQDTYAKLFAVTTARETTLAPLYVNPVHITQSK